MMSEETVNIALRGAHSGGFCLISRQDVDLVAQYKLYKTIHNGKPYISVRKGKEFRLLHRLILNPAVEECVDHIDGNGLNNCRSNLRICTRAQNQRNMRAFKTNKSGYKGVDARRGGYRASIQDDGKRVYLGHFHTAEAAAFAYNQAAIARYGEFANLNEVPSEA